MENLRTKILKILINHFGDDERRIEHALRVMYHTECIMTDYDNYDTDITIAVALLHDVGIKISEEKHGYNDGKTQEKYGPAVAETLLKSINFPAEKIEIVKNIIGNHHSKSRYDYPELAILKKADLIVNKNERI